MLRAPAATHALVLLAASWLAACGRGASGESTDAATGDDGDLDASSAGDVVTGSTVTIESPADAAAPGDGASLPAACVAYDGGVPSYASQAGGTVVGAGISAIVCTATDVEVSMYLSPANRLLLRIAGAVSTDFQSPAGATDGALALMVSVGTDTPAVYTSAEAQSCGFVAFTYTLPPAPDVTYQASATSDCFDSTTVAGSWTVTLTSVTPYGGGAGAPGSYYIAHGSLSATLQGANGGGGTVALSLSF
jgi:hypothetical protein